MIYDYDGFPSISTEKMMNYLEEKFDYLKLKYLIDDESLLSELEKLEKNEQYGRLQKLPPSYIGKTVNSVYGFHYKSRLHSINNFSNVWRKVINNFLNIKGLELLFNEHYYDFEWDMHLEVDFEKSSSVYYRDHMEHQIRNMYMMLMMLDKYGFDKIIKENFLHNPKSKVSEYVSTRFADFIDQRSFNSERRALMLKCSKSYHLKTFSSFWDENIELDKVIRSGDKRKLIKVLFDFFKKTNFLNFNDELRDSFYSYFNTNINGKKVFERKTQKNINKNNLISWISCSVDEEILLKAYYAEYTMNYIIYSATIISALFHDISYPLCFFMNMQRRVGQYLPSMNAFTHNTEADIDRIVSVLQPSLLFVLVSEKEIRNKLAKSQEKYDHGVFSAISLLLSFYESGRIHQLSKDKQIAIELAALAIYNHNFSYYINDKDEKEYYRPVFLQNPISFILKMCDDLQEWDRKYFELSQRSESVFCPYCLSPLVSYKKYNENGDMEERLICCCNSSNYEKEQFFSSRNMYTVTTCNSIDIEKRESGEKYNLIFRLNYNLIDLLHMSQISSTYSWYRAKELRKLKVLLLNQKYYSNDKSDNRINNIYLDYTMSNNPIFLKSKIILSYIIIAILGKHHIFETKEIIETFRRNVFKTFPVISKKLSVDLKKNADKQYDEDAFWDFFVSQANNSFKNELYSLKPVDLFSLYFYNQLIESCITSNKKKLEKIVVDEYNSLHPNLQINTSKIDEYLRQISCVFEENIENACAEILLSLCFKYAKDEDLLSDEQIKERIIRKESLRKKLCFYLKLASHILDSAISPPSFLESEKDFISDLTQSPYSPYSGDNTRFKEVVDNLLSDTYKIISNQVNVYDSDNFDKYSYEIQYKTKKDILYSIELYCNPINWYQGSSDEYQKFSTDNLDFHSDLYLFEILGKEIKKIQQDRIEKIKE